MRRSGIAKSEDVRKGSARTKSSGAANGRRMTPFTTRVSEGATTLVGSPDADMCLLLKNHKPGELIMMRLQRYFRRSIRRHGSRKRPTPFSKPNNPYGLRFFI
jgi:hypothetical protein